MKPLLILLICLTLAWLAGCSQTEEEILQDYAKDIQDWKVGLKPSTAMADS